MARFPAHRYRTGYYVAGGYVKTNRCTVCGGTYTRGDYASHKAEAHTGKLYRGKK
jgi:hypothetical protein